MTTTMTGPTFNMPRTRTPYFLLFLDSTDGHGSGDRQALLVLAFLFENATVLALEELAIPIGLLELIGFLLFSHWREKFLRFIVHITSAPIHTYIATASKGRDFVSLVQQRVARGGVADREADRRKSIELSEGATMNAFWVLSLLGTNVFRLSALPLEFLVPSSK